MQCLFIYHSIQDGRACQAGQEADEGAFCRFSCHHKTWQMYIIAGRESVLSPDKCHCGMFLQYVCSLTAQTSKRTSLVDEKLVELEQLDASIRSADGEMKVMTAAYEKSVQDRNGVGLMVIDRNDELSILYQKYNGQQEAIKQGAFSFLSSCLAPACTMPVVQVVAWDHAAAAVCKTDCEYHAYSCFSWRVQPALKVEEDCTPT